MKGWISILSVFILLFSGMLIIKAADEEETPSKEKNFYENSLHYTNKGLEYWYSKEQGGLERLTGIPFSELSCQRCHVRSCDACHKKEVDGKLAYSAEPAQIQEVCQKCHGIQTLEDAKKYDKDYPLDIHFKNGMNCMDCHSAREIHGDGKAYNSLQETGAMDTKCENCHDSLSTIDSHVVHGGKLDCNSCHVKELPSCYNCHFDTRVKEDKSVSLPLENILFLVNHDGKVTLANLHTFVYQNKGMIVFAPSFSHFVIKEGRACDECHDTQIVRDIKMDQFKPVVFEEGQLKSISGIIPVLDGMKWDLVFLDYKDGKWTPIEHSVEPLIHYSGYCNPLTIDQFSKLEKAASPKLDSKRGP